MRCTEALNADWVGRGRCKTDVRSRPGAAPATSVRCPSANESIQMRRRVQLASSISSFGGIWRQQRMELVCSDSLVVDCLHRGRRRVFLRLRQAVNLFNTSELYCPTRPVSQSKVMPMIRWLPVHCSIQVTPCSTDSEQSVAEATKLHDAWGVLIHPHEPRTTRTSNGLEDAAQLFQNEFSVEQRFCIY